MALNKDKNLKLYFSISEVAQMFDVNESTLRFWVKEFDQIRAEREPGDDNTPRRDRKQVETDQGRIACHEGSIRSVGSIQIALTP